MDGDGPPHHSRRNAAGDVLGRSPGWALSRKRGAEAARLRDRTDQHRRRHGKSEGRIESRVRHRRAEVIGRIVRASSFIEEISMKRCVCLAVLALLAFVSLTAQAPKGWLLRADSSTAASDPDAAGAIKFVTMGTGFHATNPQAAVYWNPANKAAGNYSLKGTFKLMKPSGHTNYYGLVFGGSGLEGPKQSSLYFLVAQDQSWLIKRRDGDVATQEVWKAASAAVKKPDAGGVGGVVDADENLAGQDFRIVERRPSAGKTGGHEHRDHRRDDPAEHGQLEHDDHVRPPRDDRHVAGPERPRHLGHAREPRGRRQPDESAGAGDVPHPGRFVHIEELVVLEGLAADHRNGAGGEPGGAQPVHGSLSRLAVRIQRIDGAHA